MISIRALSHALATAFEVNFLRFLKKEQCMQNENVLCCSSTKVLAIALKLGRLDLKPSKNL